VAAPTTTKAATTTTPEFYTEIAVDMVLDVDDTDVFQTDTGVVASLESTIAALLEIPDKEVDVLSISLVEQYAVDLTSRRLKVTWPAKAPAGKVKAAAKVKDPTNKLTPAKVKGIAPKVPAALQKNLDKNKVPLKVGPAAVNAVAAKKPNNKPDPCKVVVAPPVVAPPAPVNPCAPVVVKPAPVVVKPAPVAPVNPCAPVAKFDAEAKPVFASTSPLVLGMVSLAVPALLGLVVFIRRRRSAHDSSSYATVQDVEGQE
jgi:hypothetical protein